MITNYSEKVAKALLEPTKTYINIQTELKL